MQDSNKNQTNQGNKNLNQGNQKQPISTPGQDKNSDKKFSNNTESQTGKSHGNQSSQVNQQDRTSKR